MDCTVVDIYTGAISPKPFKRAVVIEYENETEGETESDTESENGDGEKGRK